MRNADCGIERKDLWGSVTMPTVRIHNVDIYYESHGSGFPLLLTYCLGGNTSMWSGQIDAFAKHYRFIVWDPRGHGQSESPSDPAQYGVQRSAEDLRGLLEHLGIGRAHVGGLSMGGGIAARFAVTYPERVTSLMILDSTTASGVPTSPAMREVRETTINLCEKQDMTAVAAYFLQANPNYKLYAGDSPVGRDRLHQMILALKPHGFANTIQALLQADFPTQRLARISAPTLVLAGEHDPALEAVRLTHRAIPGAQFAMIPGAGHLSNLDQPERFQHHILEFLQGVTLNPEV
jgi:pimeloyl-ACP methyl ester carboxylesterase